MSTDEEEIMELVLDELKADGIVDTPEARLLYLEMFKMVTTNALGLVDPEDVVEFNAYENAVNGLIAEERTKLSARGKSRFN